MLGQFSHIGVLVRDLPAAVRRFQTLFNATLVETGFLAESRTDVAVLDMGGVHLELLSSADPDSKVGRLLRERGEGIHHLSFEVDDIGRQLGSLAAQGVELLDAKPRTGLHGRQIAFLSPHDNGGILIELAQENRQAKETP